MKPSSFLLLLGVIMFLALCGCDCGGSDDDSDDITPADDSAPDDDSSDDTASGDDDSVPAYPETCSDGAVFTFDFESTPKIVPFPNDLYTIEDPTSPSGVRVHIDSETALPIGSLASISVLDFLIDAYNDLTGFSTLADLYLPVGEEPSADSLPDSVEPALLDGIFLMVDDAGSAYDGELVPLKFNFRSPNLHVTPWFPLKEKTHYLLVATRVLHPADSCYSASQSMRDVWTSYLTDDDSGLNARYNTALRRLGDLGLAPDQILAVADFTTGRMTRDLESAVRVLDDRAATAPASFYDWEIVPDSDPRLFATAHATFDVPIFKPAGEPWAYDENGDPAVDHIEQVRAYFTIPAAGESALPQPYPILIFEHGIFNDKYEMTPPFTTEIAAQGFAMVAIDAVCHGERLAPGLGEVGQFFCFYDLFHPKAWRDNFRESAANLIWLTRALASLEDVDLDENGIPDFDVTRIYSLGSSFGSLLGGMFSALDRNVDAFILTASGAKFKSLALEGEAAQYFDLIEIIEGLLAPDHPVTDFIDLLIDIIQGILDPADPANFVIHTINDPLEIMNGYQPQVLQQGGAYDETVGGPSGGWLCRAGGWPQMNPFVWDVDMPHVSGPYVGSAFYQFDTEEHTLIFDDDPLSDETRSQIYHFLNTHLSDGIGEIIDPLSIN